MLRPDLSDLIGTSSGFGKRLVLSALKRGDFVISSSRSSKLPADFPQSPRIHHIALDLDSGTDEIKKNVDEAVKIWGRIDVLVNNAGTVLPAMLEEGGTAILQKQLQTNLFGVLDVTNAVLPHMRARKSGTVVFSGSRSSWRTDVPVRDIRRSSIHHNVLTILSLLRVSVRNHLNPPEKPFTDMSTAYYAMSKVAVRSEY